MPRRAARAPPPAPLAPLLLLALLAPAFAPALAQAQAQAPAPGLPAMAAMPADLTAQVDAWVQRAAQDIAAAKQARPGANTSVAEKDVARAQGFRDRGGLTLAMAELFQVQVALAHQAFLAQGGDSAAQRARLLTLMNASATASAPRLDALAARFQAFEGRVATTHGLERGALAALAYVEAREDFTSLQNATDQVTKAEALPEGLVVYGLFAATAPTMYGGFAEDLLTVAERGDSGPKLSAGALDAMQREVDKRIDADPDSGSITGPQSNRALVELRKANGSGERLVALARFHVFEQARSYDALEFLRSHGQLSDAVLQGNLVVAVNNASVVPHYDAQLVSTSVAPADRARGAGYEGLVLRDARNDAIHALEEEPGYASVRQGWTHLVGAGFASNALAEARGEPGGLDASSLAIFAGIAVAAALAVVAFMVLRKGKEPETPP